MIESCRQCGKIVAAVGTVCPNCGATLRAVSGLPTFGLSILGGILVAFGAIFVWALLGLVVGFGTSASVGARIAPAAIVVAYNGVIIALALAAFSVGVLRAKRGERGAALIIIPAIVMLVPTSFCAASVLSGPH